LSSAALGAELAAAREHDADWLKWLARERERRKNDEDETSERGASMGPPSRSGRTIADFAARAQAASAIPLEGPADGAVPTVAPPGSPLAPQQSAPSAAASEPSPGAYILSRKEWLRRELDQERTRERDLKRARAKVEKYNTIDDEGVQQEWGVERERRLIEARAKVRKGIEGRVADAKAMYVALANDPQTAHFAIGIKKICDAKRWTLADIAAQRTLTLLCFLLELAVPGCWNVRYSKPAPRRGGRLVRFGDAFTRRKYSPVVRAVAQPFLRSVIAWRGHSPDDDRSVDRSTVFEHMALLEHAKLVQPVQVPIEAAEPHEIGKLVMRKSGGKLVACRFSINRYWLADRGNPKPALLGCWTADGVCVDIDVLAAPWAGATPVDSPPTSPP